MAITKKDPNTILLAGCDCCVLVGDVAAGAAITPGHIVEMYDVGGAMRWRKSASATEQVHLAVALEQGELNKGVDDDYAALDLVKAAFLCPGSVIWGLVASGETIANGTLLQSAGDGTLKAATATTATANLAKFQSLDNLGAVTTLTRVRAQVIQ